MDAKQYAKELHTQARKHFERRPVVCYYPNEIWGADLLDVSNVQEDNDGIKFLLIIVDIYSRYAWALPLKSKKGKDVLHAFKLINTLPKFLWVDEGTEFFNKDVMTYFKENNVSMYHTYSGLKSVFAERFNRTLREIMYRYFTEHNTDKYIDVLEKLIENYNNTVHSRLKEKPIDVYKSKVKPNIMQFNVQTQNQKFQLGDYVRISKVKQTFEKGYTHRWSKEVFRVAKIYNHLPIQYSLIDLKGDEIKGKFYNEELQKTDLKDFAVVEKILEKKKVKGKKMFLVKYDGYSDKFNEYLTTKQLEDIL
jgi:hypothetical protein